MEDGKRDGEEKGDSTGRNLGDNEINDNTFPTSGQLFFFSFSTKSIIYPVRRRYNLNTC